MQTLQRVWSVILAVAMMTLVISGTCAHAATAAPELSPELQAALARTTIGVIPFEGADEKLAGQITDILSAFLTASGEVDLVERAKLSQVLEELGMGQAGLVDPLTAQRVGYLVGAQALVMGRVFELDRSNYIIARLVGVETGRVFVLKQDGPVSGKIAPLVEALAEDLSQTVADKKTLLTARDISQDTQALLAKMAESLKGKSKSAIMVDIPEVHYGRAAVDPAVETEIILWAQQSGFQVFDPKSAMPALDKLPPEIKVVILGEAFSEAAGEFGRFHAAKVRAEVRAIDRETGQIVAIARRVDVVADLGERIAAKKGLSLVGASIAYEMLPKIVAYTEKKYPGL